MGETILTVNAGSSSLKLAAFGPGGRLTAQVAEIGPEARLTTPAGTRTASCADHPAALDAGLAALAGQGVRLEELDAAAHRIVHGGPGLSEPTRLTPEVLRDLAACAPLAPLHNPPALAVIAALSARLPHLRQVGCFDTGFHATIPEVATRYALPDRPETADLRRYGFHGISYAGLIDALPRLIGGPLPRRILACHLGNGASLCAIAGGRSVATTMGYSPLDGLTMGTRAGTIDPVPVLRLAERLGPAQAERLLNEASGLKGLAGRSDMRELARSDDDDARFAVRHFRYWAVRHAGSMVAAMGGLDLVAFSGGIGENDSGTRAAILDGLAFLGVTLDAAANLTHGPALHRPGSRVTAWVVPADEEATMARWSAGHFA